MEKEIKLEGGIYRLTELEPDKALEFFTDTAIALSPILSGIDIGDGDKKRILLQVIPNLGNLNEEKVKKCFEVAKEFVILPNGELMSNSYHFHEWFKVHRRDLILIYCHAVWELLTDFFPFGAGTTDSVKK